MARPERGERRRQILEALASELESGAGDRITTARLAAAVGVSEAALYRHFPSKAKMFEALIVFAEETVFGLVARVVREEGSAEARCARILAVVLGFAERNPGITRVLLGEPLTGEDTRLRDRAAQFFDRLETELRTVLRDDPARGAAGRGARLGADAGLLLAAAEGRILQYRRSGFRRRPTEHWDAQWAALARAVFGSREA